MADWPGFTGTRLRPPAVIVATCLLCVVSTAQEPEDREPAGEVENLAAPEQQVEVAAVSDEEIRLRLQQILESTGRYESPEVRVESGVVFLSGRTNREEYRDWARDLALRTEDVVAVVNNIEVELAAESIWDFEPAVAELRGLGQASIRQLPLIVFAFLLLFLTFLVAAVARLGLRPVLRRRIENPLLRSVARNMLLALVLLVGLYLVLRVSGLTRLAFTVIGGTGLFGLVAGFAFRDIAENFLASVLISIQKPFRTGDTIEVAGHTGIVQKVTTRGTVLMAYDGNYIQLPNATVYKSVIRNFTSNPKLRLDFTVGVGYDEDVEAVQALLLGVVQRHPAVFDDPEPRVFVEKLGASTVELHVYFWINIAEYSQFKVRSSVMRQSVAELVKAGVSLPDSDREIVFPRGVPVQMIRDETAPGKRRDDARAGTKPAKRGVAKRQAARRRAADDAPAVTEAEGNFGSEFGELQAQANAAHMPEAGEDILAEDDDAERRGG